jgi:hypothetical protein
MDKNSLLNKLEMGLRFFSGLVLTLLVFQGIGVLTYALTVWPKMGNVPSIEITVLCIAAVTAGLSRSFLWILIYWNGAKVISTLRANGESTELPDKLIPILRFLTKLLVANGVLDFLLLPSIFLMDTFFPFTLSSVHIGLAQATGMLIPQVFGIGALILAYLTHQYGRLIKERYEMKKELELII